MRIVLAGYGSIGRRHLANIRRLEQSAKILVLRHDQTEKTVPLGADALTFSLEDAVAFAPEAAFICGPAVAHAETGVALAQAGAHLFVEKPLTADLSSAELLVHTCASLARILVVGYNLRFAPGLGAMRTALMSGSIGRAMSVRAEVGQYLPDWRAGFDYRGTTSARARLGGGVVLELSHEFDYVRWLFGEVVDVRALTARVGNLEIDVEDNADVILTCESGLIANVHMDMVQRCASRTCHVSGIDGMLTWNGITDSVRTYRPTDGWKTTYESSPADSNATYLREAESFFAAIRGECAPAVSGIDGLRALEIALAVKLSAMQGRAVRLGERISVR